MLQMLQFGCQFQRLAVTVASGGLSAKYSGTAHECGLPRGHAVTPCSSHGQLKLCSFPLDSSFFWETQVGHIG